MKFRQGPEGRWSILENIDFPTVMAVPGPIEKTYVYCALFYLIPPIHSGKSKINHDLGPPFPIQGYLKNVCSFGLRKNVRPFGPCPHWFRVIRLYLVTNILAILRAAPLHAARKAAA